MGIPEFIEENPDFFLSKPIESDAWKAVTNQATEHTRRKENSEILDRLRPNEDESVRSYRQDNRRLMTVEGVDRFVNKTSRIFSNSGISYSKDSISDNLESYLESNPFSYIGQRVDIMDFFYNCILTRSIEDPNAIFVSFPYNKDNPNTPPSFSEFEGGLPSNKRIDVKPIIIESKDIVLMPQEGINMFGWVAGEAEIEEGKIKQTHDYFFLADEENYYLYYPDRFDKNKKVIYELVTWYNHDTGLENNRELPLNILAGNLKVLDVDSSKKYHESFLHPYFEKADEFIGRFSDNQAVAVRFSYPKTVSVPFLCQEQGCDKGTIKTYKDGKVVNSGKCHACNGEGIITNIGPYANLTRPDRSNNVNKGSNDKPLEYVTAPTDILKHSYDTPFDILLRGLQSIGLDILMGVNESGTAKERRLEDLQDFLMNVAKSYFKVLERCLWFTECLLNVERKDRIKPKVVLPQTLKVYDSETLLLKYKETIQSNKLMAALRLVESEYQGNPVILRMYELMYCYCPLLLLDREDLELRLANGTYNNKMIRKSDFCQNAFKEVSKDSDFMDIDTEEVFRRVDEWIDRFSPQQETILRDANGNPIERGGN